MGVDVFGVLAGSVLVLHFLWIGWVIFGCLMTPERPVLSSLHIGSLLYSIVIEMGPWPCPLTLAEQWLQRRAGGTAYEGGFLTHYLEAIVYPDIPQPLLTWCAVAVCLFNLGVYGIRFWRLRSCPARRVRIR